VKEYVEKCDCPGKDEYLIINAGKTALEMEH
jgi:hypothetical protein